MGRQARHFYEFDSYRVDETEHVLLRGGEPVPLSPKLFDTLLALVRNSGHIVEKEDLIRQVWPDTFVEENNLSQYISTLRRTLGDGRHEQRYIETVPRRGYRFAVCVREGWDTDDETVSATRTKVSLSVKEETDEVDDSVTRQHVETRSYGKTARAASPMALAALVVVAAGGVFGLYQFNGQRRPATESRVSHISTITPRVSPVAPAPQAFKIKTFDPSVWPRADADLGVEGFVIEDFEDATLVEGLQIELSDSATDNFGPTAKLPMVFNPDFNDTGGARVFVEGVWDGARVLINRRTPPPHGYSDYVWGDTTFHIPGGAASFGFSLHEMDRDTELSVNGAFLVNLRRLLPSGSTRGGFVRIDAAPGQAIYAVKVANSVTDTTGDGLAFDHVAFKPLPPQR
jgi:DNA-binding winged helix-turn-helix (wHTH) protein